MATGGDQHEGKDPTARAFPVIALLLLQLLLIQVVSFVWYYFQWDIYPQQKFWLFGLAFNLTILGLTIAGVTVVRRVFEAFREEVEGGVRAESLGHIEELLQSIRVQRHDFVHHLQAVYGLLEVEAYAEARDYLAKRFEEIAPREELVRLDNLAVAALLYTKLGIAEARGVHIELSVEGSLAKLPLKEEEANRLIGNLLDNAVDAVTGLPSGHRLVRVVTGNTEEGFWLCVANRAPDLSPQGLEKIFQPGFTTKPGKHGMGLFSVQQIACGYGGWVQADCSPDGMVEFKVWIPAGK